MHQINTRAVLLCSQAALPYLKKSAGHILNLSPPLNLATQWFAQYSPYTVTKYGMSMLTLGMSEIQLRHQRQLAVATDDDCHSGHRVSAGLTGVVQARQDAGDHGRCGACDSEQRESQPDRAVAD
jgi:NAD(P)-dependent dehydrogenase (short-subunit alcohol dehydrogenase family)